MLRATTLDISISGQGVFQDTVVGRFGSREVRNHAALSHYVDIVGQADELLELRCGDDNDAVSFDGDLPEQRMNLGFRVHVDALCWFLDQKHAGIALECAGNRDLLLIAAA